MCEYCEDTCKRRNEDENQYLYINQILHNKRNKNPICIGGLVVKLAVAKLNSSVSASPGFDSRPMHTFFLPQYHLRKDSHILLPGWRHWSLYIKNGHVTRITDSSLSGVTLENGLFTYTKRAHAILFVILN